MTSLDDYYRGHRVDAMQAADGTWRGYVDQRQVCIGSARAMAIRLARGYVDRAIAEQQERAGGTARPRLSVVAESAEVIPFPARRSA